MLSTIQVQPLVDNKYSTTDFFRTAYNYIELYVQLLTYFFSTSHPRWRFSLFHCYYHFGEFSHRTSNYISGWRSGTKPANSSFVRIAILSQRKKILNYCS